MTQTRFKKIPFDLELAKKITNKEMKGRSEAYREFGHIIEHYKNLADAKNTATKGA